MKIAIRADASFRLGAGHVARCLTLAQTLRGKGAEVRFVSRDLPGHMSGRLRDDGFDVALLPVTTLDATGDDPAFHSDADASQTLHALDELHLDWLIADHYGIDLSWDRALRATGAKIMAIDDLANRKRDCDVLLDQNLFLAGAARYDGLVPDRCKVLAGPTYALINREYAKRRSQPLRARERLDRILLYFGGGNTSSALLKSLSVLSEPEFAHIAIDIVAHPGIAGFADVKIAAHHRPNTMLHAPLPHLADLMTKADLALGGGGASTWERMCLGLPSIIVVMADNQRQLADELAQQHLTINLGDIDMLDAGAIRSALRRSASPGFLADASQRLLSLCDGEGADRVAQTLMSLNNKS